MKFRTEIALPISETPINIKDSILTMGSCFADCFGKRLIENKFDVKSNPFGVIFNPVSLFNLLIQALKNQPPPASSFIKNQDVWYHFDLHSDHSNTDLNLLSHNVDDMINQVHHFLKSANFLVLTFGTAFIYELASSGRLVANCHKLPASAFNKRMLKVDEIIASFSNLYAQIKTVNKPIKIIFTVSPVRHIKDSLEKNSVSKAVLRLAIEEIKALYPEVDYFPSYEILLDDLRDYRFYKADMLHPNEIAEDYIWNKFIERYFDTQTTEFINEWQKVKKSLQHKPFHPSSKNHQQFLVKTLEQLQRLNTTVNLSEEITTLRASII